MFYFIFIFILAALYTMWMLVTDVDKALAEPEIFWPSNFEF